MPVEHDFLFKFVIVGDQSVGKTSLLLRYTDNSFTENYLTTIGCDFKIKTIPMDHKMVGLQMWDTSGQERFKSLASSFYRNADGLLIVFDVTSQESFSKVPNWLQDAEYFSGKYPIKERLLVGNKADLVTERTVDFKKAKTLADQLGMAYVETSAREGVNVNQAFEALTQRLLDSRGDLVGPLVGGQQRLEGDVIRLGANTINSTDTGWSSYCCSYT